MLASFRYLYDDNDAHERGEVISITRRLLKRLESSRAHLQRTKPLPGRDEKTLRYYNEFLCNLQKFLLLELDPSVSYQRHVLALQTVKLLLQVGPGAQFDAHPLASSIASLILDPFEDVRSLAAILLKDLIELSFDGTTPPFLLALLRSAERLSAKTCRHDHADAAGRLWAVVNSKEGFAAGAPITLFDRLQKLDDRTDTIENLMRDSALPLHATLLGLTRGLGAGSETVVVTSSGLVESCEKLWTMAQPLLCVDSPENENDNTDENGGPKDLLAYSWRALRDSRCAQVPKIAMLADT